MNLELIITMYTRDLAIARKIACNTSSGVDKCSKIIYWVCALYPPLGRGTLLFSYIRRLRSFLGVRNFEFQYLFRFSET